MRIIYGKSQEIKYSLFHRRYMPVFLCKPEYSRGGVRIIGWKFKCPVCQKNHSHSPYEGPREAHCTHRDSPLKQTGYLLKFDPDAKLKISYIEASKACPYENNTQCKLGPSYCCTGNIFDCPHKIHNEIELLY